MYNNKTYIIAEAGLNHNGSLDIAKKLIDVAKESGADAVKFQKRTVSILATNEILNKPDDRFPEFGNTYREIRKFLEFNKEEYLELKSYSKKNKLDFIVTPFDNQAFDFLEEIDIDAYKIASHSLTNLNFIKYVSNTKKKIILSTGMCTIEDIDLAVDILNKNDNLSLLHCVSSYPTKIEESNLNMINFLKNRYGLQVGYSGHELGYLPTIVAVSLGSKIIERHYTLDKKMVGFDHKISLEPDELVDMIKKIRDIEKLFGTTNKIITEREKITQDKYHVSIISKNFIKKGDQLSYEDIIFKNPGTGIPPKEINTIIGRVAKTDIQPDTILKLIDFE